ncbi:acetyltransferase (GNAT) family domain-containing protein [Ditylenchus destructor]|uniref:Acetyltransferase (GNAT) family domain-containing protein n=1 Tax=Ditylenchus destructor TaxID=166010 RepID=A0AAD4MSI4_9BILA|nr:acetyltransferase (GNAT) family domain-containing protein [Ditylenchus destructor]
MNFTPLIVALVLTHLYPVSGMNEGTSTPKDPGCTVTEAENDFLVCKNGSESYGTLQYLALNSETLLIDDLTVKKEYRRQGVATALLNYLIKTFAPRQGFKRIELFVDSGKDQDGAVKFYKSTNFKEDENVKYKMILTL